MAKFNPLILIVPLLVIVGSFIIISSLQEQTIYSAFTNDCIGFNDIALSNVDYLSNDPTIEGPAWNLALVQNCQGRYAVGEYPASSITDSNDNAFADNGFKITLSLDEQTCSYPLQVQGSPFYLANYETRDLGFFGSEVEFRAECEAKTPLTEYFGRRAGTNIWTCFWLTEEGKHGVVGTPSLNFESSIIVESHGETKTGTISSTGPSSVNVGDVGRAIWNGNVVTGDSCPSAGDYSIGSAYVGLSGQGSWRTIDDLKYNEYINYLGSGFEQCITRYLDFGSETPQTCIQEFNGLVDDSLSIKNLVSVGGAEGVSSGAIDSGKVVLNPVKALQYPLITLKLQADWLGIFVPVGQPDVTYTSSNEFQTGTTGLINAEIKNVGDAFGSFNVYATCPSPFSQTGSTQTINVQQSSTSQVSIPITASCSETTTETCTVYAQDTNNPNNVDSKDVQVTCKPQVLCAAGETRCNGNFIQTCSASGSGWSNTNYCDSGCEIDQGEPVCSSPDIGGGVVVPDEEVDLELVGLIILTVAFAAFAILIYTRSRKGKIRK